MQPRKPIRGLPDLSLLLALPQSHSQHSQVKKTEGFVDYGPYRAQRMAGWSVDAHAERLEREQGVPGRPMGVCLHCKEEAFGR